MLEAAFSKNPEPSIYIISPFSTVVFGIKEYIKNIAVKIVKKLRLTVIIFWIIIRKRLGLFIHFKAEKQMK